MSTRRRETRETRVRVEITPRAAAAPRCATGQPFLDHMLVTLARYAGLDLDVERPRRSQAPPDRGRRAARSAPRVAALCERPVARYGAALIPMDDALVQAALDLGGRHYYEGRCRAASTITGCARSACRRPPRSTCVCCAACDRHHVIEAAFKALGLACVRRWPRKARCSAPRACLAGRGGDDASATTRRGAA
jgi:imidazoleglycerol-phosphate dehydratase